MLIIRIVLYNNWYHHILYVAFRPHTKCDDTRCCINTVWPPDDEHTVSRNMWRNIIINVLYNVTVHQIGHLPRVLPGYTVSETQQTRGTCKFRNILRRQSNISETGSVSRKLCFVRDPTIRQKKNRNPAPYSSVRYAAVRFGSVQVRAQLLPRNWRLLHLPQNSVEGISTPEDLKT